MTLDVIDRRREGDIAREDLAKCKEWLIEARAACSAMRESAHKAMVKLAETAITLEHNDDPTATKRQRDEQWMALALKEAFKYTSAVACVPRSHLDEVRKERDVAVQDAREARLEAGSARAELDRIVPPGLVEH